MQGVLTVEDPAYIFDPDLRLLSGELIHLVYLDERPGEERTDEENPASQLLEEKQWYETLLIAEIGLGEQKVTYAPSMPPGITLQLRTTEMKHISEELLEFLNPATADTSGVLIILLR